MKQVIVSAYSIELLKFAEAYIKAYQDGVEFEVRGYALFYTGDIPKARLTLLRAYLFGVIHGMGASK